MSKPGFSICVGPDPVLLKDYIAEQISAFAPPTGKHWQSYTFWADDPMPPEFTEKLTLQGLFQEPKVVILRHAETLKIDVLRKISNDIGRPDPLTWAFLCFEVDFDKGKPKLGAHIPKLQCIEFARKKGWLKEIPPLSPQAKKTFVQKEAKKQGLKLTTAELEQICALLPQDAGAIKLELGKVALAAGPDGKLTPQALQMLNFEQELNIFDLLRTIQAGNHPQTVWAQYMRNSEDSTDAGLFGFLAILQNEARAMWQLLAGEQPGYMRNPEQKLALARALGFGNLARVWNCCLNAEKGVKTGERNPYQAFEMLIADLFKLFGNA